MMIVILSDMNVLFFHHILIKVIKLAFCTPLFLYWAQSSRYLLHVKSRIIVIKGTKIFSISALSKNPYFLLLGLSSKTKNNPDDLAHTSWKKITEENKNLELRENSAK